MIGTAQNLQREKELYKAIREFFYSTAAINDSIIIQLPKILLTNLTSGIISHDSSVLWIQIFFKNNAVVSSRPVICSTGLGHEELKVPKSTHVHLTDHSTRTTKEMARKQDLMQRF